MVVSDQVVDVTAEDLSDPRAIVASDMVMGNGTADDIQDIVFVRPDKFSPITHACDRSESWNRSTVNCGIRSGPSC